MRCTTLATVALAVIALPAVAHSVTIHVPEDRPTIQAGIDAASYGDTVLVACGTYYEHDIVMRSGVHLRGETGDPASVTVDAQWMGRVFHCSQVDSLARIEGLTATGGMVTGERTGRGGGMLCEDSSVRIASCIFRGNSTTTSGRGGAVYCQNSYLFEESPVFSGCEFSDNLAAIGAGIYIIGSWPTISGCVFENNSANSGAGIHVEIDALPTISDCLFAENAASMLGGGIRIDGDEYYEVLVSRCVFYANSAGWGGGAYFQGFAAFDSCIFSENSAEYGGGVYGAFPRVCSCTFWGNSGVWGGGLAPGGGSYERTIVAFSGEGAGIWCSDPDYPPTLTCCNVFGNSGGDWVGCIADQLGADGNIAADPLFCSPETHDFRLSCQSPCAPAQQPDCGLIGALGVGCGPTATVPGTWGMVKSLFEMKGE